jgi:hypothetical protein
MPTPSGVVTRPAGVIGRKGSSATWPGEVSGIAVKLAGADLVARVPISVESATRKTVCPTA